MTSLKPCLTLITSAFLFILTGNLQAQDAYTYRKADPEGTGKWYLGREIAPVMSHYGIGWLERGEREEEERASLLLKNMELKPGEIVADIGAGSGYHVVRMAPMVGKNGKVLAVDIQQEMLDFIENRVKKVKLSNVETLLGAEKSAQLPQNSIDKMLLVDVYHEFEFPAEMGRSLFGALRPGGFLYLIEYRAEDLTVPIKRVHKMTETQAVKEMQALGFQFVKNIDNLPWQHCLVFAKPRN
jgi:protein-L-isoaspartate O-methyltransferase